MGDVCVPYVACMRIARSSKEVPLFRNFISRTIMLISKWFHIKDNNANGQAEPADYYHYHNSTTCKGCSNIPFHDQ